jgi:L-lactate dehydrogenase
VGLTIAEVIHAIAHDKRQVLPVATVQQGAYGLRGTAISVPTVVGRRGALAHVEVELWPKELQALQASARALNETFAKVKAG